MSPKQPFGDMTITDYGILLGEVKGLVQRALDQHDHLVEKIDALIKDQHASDERDSQARVEELRKIREFVETEDRKLREALISAQARADEHDKLDEAAHRSFEEFKTKALTKDHIGTLGLSAWQLFFGAVWTVGMLYVAHLWK